MLINVWSDKTLTYDEVWGGGHSGKMTEDDYEALKEELGES